LTGLWQGVDATEVPDLAKIEPQTLVDFLRNGVRIAL
jgi:hypothetical protein